MTMVLCLLLVEETPRNLQDGIYEVVGEAAVRYETVGDSNPPHKYDFLLRGGNDADGNDDKKKAVNVVGARNSVVEIVRVGDSPPRTRNDLVARAGLNHRDDDWVFLLLVLVVLGVHDSLSEALDQ